LAASEKARQIKGGERGKGLLVKEGSTKEKGGKRKFKEKKTKHHGSDQPQGKSFKEKKRKKNLGRGGEKKKSGPVWYEASAEGKRR